MEKELTIPQVSIQEREEEVRFIRKNEVIVDERLHSYVREALGRKAYSDLLWMYSRYKQDVPRASGVGSGIVNAYRINDIFQINKFLEKANRRLDFGQYFVICMETKDARKQRILNRFPIIFTFPYYCIDFLFTRVLPKLELTRQAYFRITHGRKRVLSFTEGLGRLACCGFDIAEFRHMGDLTCIIARKVRKPNYHSHSATGALICLKRVGEGGKIIEVYKMRTMHPYSEYLQDFVFERFNIQDGGKFNNDFRLTNWGRIFRKYWIDELPMFINWFKGEMKLVGVRPLSRHYFKLYPKELQERRTKVKPGLIPPYYADMPNGMEEIQQSELDYLNSYEQQPILTDIRYFFKVLVNIFFRGARSQ